jgi:hypothetical protein
MQAPTVRMLRMQNTEITAGQTLKDVSQAKAGRVVLMVLKIAVRAKGAKKRKLGSVLTNLQKQITTDRCSSGGCTENEHRRRVICRCMEQKHNRDAIRAKAARVQLDLRRTPVVFLLVMRQVNMRVAQATTAVILAMSTTHETSGDTGQRMIIHSRRQLM